MAEPKLEDLEVGDTGVGRLVTFKDESQNNLASLIIGDAVKDREGQRYVRKPGQDPVYVVKLDDTPLTTQFNAWIEDDLLQLSSIDIENVEIKDYNASLDLGGFSLTRNYSAQTFDGWIAVETRRTAGIRSQKTKCDREKRSYSKKAKSQTRQN